MTRKIPKVRFKSVRPIFYRYKFINHKRVRLAWRLPASEDKGEICSNSEYNPQESENLTRSCLFDPVVFQTWSSPLPENMRIRPNQKPEQGSLTRDLLDNVYAQSLCQPVRAESLSSIPVPRFLLQRFGAFTPPKSDDGHKANTQMFSPWILPVIPELRPLPSGKNLYFLLDKSIIATITKTGVWKGGYARLNRLKRRLEIERVNLQLPSKDKTLQFPVWRADMSDFLHRELLQALAAYIDNDKLLGKLRLVQMPLHQLSRKIGRPSAILTFATPSQDEPIVTFKRDPIDGAPIFVYHIKQLLPLENVKRISDQVQHHQTDIIVLSKSSNNHFLQLLLKIAIYDGHVF